MNFFQRIVSSLPQGEASDHLAGADKRAKPLFVESDHDAFTQPRNWAPEKIRLRDDELRQFFAGWNFLIKPTLFVDGVAGVEERRNRIVPEDGFNLFRRERLFCVIAFDKIVGGKFAQETPRVAAGRSTALVPEIDHQPSVLPMMMNPMASSPDFVFSFVSSTTCSCSLTTIRGRPFSLVG